MKKLILILILILLASCQKYPDPNEPGGCEPYGVEELNHPMGEINSINEVYDSEVVKFCGHSGWVDRQLEGCAKINENDTVDIYYRTGDKCTLNHEICHAKHGKQHTNRYIKDLLNKHPRAACPP